MAGFIDTLEQAVLNHVLNDGSYSPPVAWYVALGTTATTPTDTGAGFTEVSGGSYARVSTSAATWNAASGTAPAIKDNGQTITFPQATAAWGVVGYFGLFGAVSGGTVQIFGTLTGGPYTISTGTTPSFAPGALVIKLGDPGDSY